MCKFYTDGKVSFEVWIRRGQTKNLSVLSELKIFHEVPEDLHCSIFHVQSRGEIIRNVLWRKVRQCSFCHYPNSSVLNCSLF